MPKSKDTMSEEEQPQAEATLAEGEAPPPTGINGEGEDVFATTPGPSASADPNGGEQAAATQATLAGTAGATPEEATNVLAEEEAPAS